MSGIGFIGTFVMVLLGWIGLTPSNTTVTDHQKRNERAYAACVEAPGSDPAECRERHLGRAPAPQANASGEPVDVVIE